MVPLFRSPRFRLIILAVEALLLALGVIIYHGLEERRQVRGGGLMKRREVIILT